jgi:CRP-like cAMP-binding protein
MDSGISEKIKKNFNKGKFQGFKKGELLIRADENPQGVYYLTQGLVKQYAISKKGEEIVVNIFKPIAFFPMSWAINETRNIYYFEAVDNVEVYRCPREDAVEFVKQNPDVLFNLMSRVYWGLDGILSRMVYLMSERAYDRLIIELLIQGRRFGKNVGKGSIEIKITERELASQSGMTRETVSREIKKLKTRGLVQVINNSLIVKDFQKLEDELSDGD